MAKENFYTVPLDTPRPVPLRESDFHGSNKFGAVTVAGDSPEGRARGNRGWSDLPERRFNDSGASPVERLVDHRPPKGPVVPGPYSDMHNATPSGAGWERVVKSLKKESDVDNPWALAHWMKAQGYKPKRK
jgi:hypothetical protein